MAGPEILWIEGVANRGKELIFPGRHVQQHEWKPEWNCEFPNHYDYISDYECPFPYSKERHEPNLSLTKKEKLRAAKQQRDPILINILVHCTPFPNMNGIILDKGFKGGEKKINSTQKAYLSWWSPRFSNDVGENLQNQMQGYFSQFTDDQINNINDIKEQFGKSDCFFFILIANKGMNVNVILNTQSTSCLNPIKTILAMRRWNLEYWELLHTKKK
ncbi:uncharacterized protein LOC124436684 [Xenia sp. Carnegie-2017]|uniref:uncharacterized protein LOC124436684 n=1 Tax=Xenia sp. Carnegie-2017 TaxID=2897299 RepID=UPI001F033F9A|nr:uncharacterized protein LOC124436684 [Xenia sp. Carnegie-2017]